MPKKLFRRWLPDHQALQKKRFLRWLGPVLSDPYLLHINRDSVSKSFFIGLFCCYVPIPGQTIVVALLALAMRANLPLAISLIWISNPLTMPAMFYLSYKFGTLLVGTREASSFSFEPTWDWFVAQGSHIMLPLFTGSLIFGLVLGLTGFFVIRYLWRWKVINDWGRRRETRLQRKMKEAEANEPPQSPHS